jgi:ATP-dependent 26S proteasome regulatory subunit
MGKMPKSKDLTVRKIVTQTKGFSGADLKATCVEAAMVAIRAKRKSVNSKDFRTAIERISEKKANSTRGDAPENLFH